MGLRKIVLDVLKPLKGHSIPEFAETLISVEGVRRVSVIVNEIDVETVTLTVTVEGPDIDYGDLKETVERLGAVIHSVDQVVVESEEEEE
ncbi:MAG: DUF211 domain-containing protein [Desulfurococcales archaeon]|nr:DUF211 domain-containing protein [Desulfurococcales archaeon]